MTPLRVTIRALRQAKGLSQQALADLAQVRQPTISDLESGTARRVTLDVLDRIANVLGVEPGELIEREQAPKKRRGR